MVKEIHIDTAIVTIDKAISKNINRFDDSERGLLSQNIIAQLRNFVEHIALKAYSSGRNLEDTYSNIQEALKFVQERGSFKFLSKFHKFLQPVASHYTLDENNSERLMLKYYEYLLRIKSYLKDIHNLEVLKNIEEFPLELDITTKEYYEKIAYKINSYRTAHVYNERYYIQKIKPFFVNFEVYYEVTFTRANDNVSKFDRIIAFTKLDLSSNYAVKLSLSDNSIEILEKQMPIHIIESWEVSIRPCEIENFMYIFGNYPKIRTNNKEYQNLMKFLTNTGVDLAELVTFSEQRYQGIRDTVIQDVKVVNFFNVLDRCYELISKKYSGYIVLQYLLYKLNNKIIKKQYNYTTCSFLSDLRLQWGCIPFEQMPFNTSLIGHNPKLYDLFDCLDPNNREHELFARVIKNNTEIKGELYTSTKDLKSEDKIDNLIKQYNNALYYKHRQYRSIQKYNDFVYIAGYELDTIDIIKEIKRLAASGIKGYTESIDSWLKETTYHIDCKDKKTSLRQMFENSNVALIYGSAGTGKSTMINHISQFFHDYKKLYLANTNPATDNLKRKVHASNCEFKTIAKFLSEKRAETDFNLLFIDECSTVSNSDMLSVLNKASFTLLVLVGDIFQIESISFGNWFSVLQSFIPKSAITELTIPYRTNNSKLLELWRKVRNIDEDILEHIATNNYSTILDDSIFVHSENDEIILCLNYDGLYGINNINKFLQGNNENNPILWGNLIYKVNDPILFNETKRFGPSIYNNLKGRIVYIKTLDDYIKFDIEIDKTINELDTLQYDFKLLKNLENGNSAIQFHVAKHKSTDEDDESSDAVIPFQIAYAVSIHKAQGLEYNSVKIVITNEVEEMITHNIFYTAITRAKEKLKIYWSPETENKILTSLEKRNSARDVGLLKSKMRIEN